MAQMLRQIWQELLVINYQVTNDIHEKKQSQIKLRPLSEQEYQKLFFQILAGISQDWGQPQVLRHLRGRVNDQWFLAWLRDYGRKLRQNPVADHQLEYQLDKLSQLGCGEISKIAAELSRNISSNK